MQKNKNLGLEQNETPLAAPSRNWVCKNCGKCCQWGGGFILKEEKQAIANYLNINTNTLEKNYLEKVDMFGTEAWKPKSPKPFGPCIFYDKKQHCKIHVVKPLLCRLANCEEDVTKKFIEKHFVDKNNKEGLDLWKLRQRINNNKKGA